MKKEYVRYTDGNGVAGTSVPRPSEQDMEYTNTQNSSIMAREAARQNDLKREEIDDTKKHNKITRWIAIISLGIAIVSLLLDLHACGIFGDNFGSNKSKTQNSNSNIVCEDTVEESGEAGVDEPSPSPPEAVPPLPEGEA